MKKALLVALMGMFVMGVMVSAHELNDADGNPIAHTHIAADLNCDGIVDISDVAVSAYEFGKHSLLSEIDETTATPEVPEGWKVRLAREYDEVIEDDPETPENEAKTVHHWVFETTMIVDLDWSGEIDIADVATVAYEFGKIGYTIP